MSAARATPDTRVVVLFYFSGHSDGASLELGRERLPYADLRRWLAETQADVRVAIVDSCRSGALLRLKGGRPGPGFELQLTDELHSTGQALLSSSAENEMALESREVGGSFFTHHLVSGLRGAADVSGDGLVTLAEAYQYAYAHTVSATADVLLGGQHPVYDYQLTGKGELVLTQLTRPGAVLELPPDFQRVLLQRPGQGQVLAELGPGAVPRLAIPAGDYELRMWKGGQQHSATVSATAGQVRRVRWEELGLVAPSDSEARAKGSETPSASVFPELRIALGGGIRDAAARGMGPQAGIARGGERPGSAKRVGVLLDPAVEGERPSSEDALHSSVDERHPPFADRAPDIDERRGVRASANGRLGLLIGDWLEANRLSEGSADPGGHLAVAQRLRPGNHQRLPGVLARRQGAGDHLGDVVRMDEGDLPLARGGPEHALGGDRIGPAERVRHERRRPDEREREAALSNGGLAARMPWAGPHARAHVQRRELDQVLDPGSPGGERERAIPDSEPGSAAQEKHCINPGEGSGESGARTGQIADPDFDAVPEKRSRLLRVAHEHARAIAPCKEAPGYLRADVTGRARDQILHRALASAQPRTTSSAILFCPSCVK